MALSRKMRSPGRRTGGSSSWWLFIMLGMLGAMMGVVVVTGVTGALHPPSNVETIDPTTLGITRVWRKRVSAVFGSGQRAANAPEFAGN
jgi:hypothetical protein